MSRRIRSFGVVVGLAIAVSLAGCGDDDAPPTEQAPPLTNELGVETFEPSADPFDTEETVDPS